MTVAMNAEVQNHVDCESCLLGLVIFIVGGISNTGILLGIAMYRFAHKTGGIAGGNRSTVWPSC